MRKSAYLLSAVIIGTALGSAVHAQQSTNEAQPQQQQPRETTPQAQDSHSEGTKPENMGTTGWTGGTGGSHIGTSNTLTEDGTATKGTTGAGSPDTKDMTPNSETAKDQPLMATGVDLKGPPTRFPANKTPE